MADQSQTAGVKPDRGIGTAVIIGSIASAVFVFLLVGLGMWATTGSAGFGFALAAFCSAWVGPGFGVMVGGIMNAMAEERAAKVGSAVTPAAAPITGEVAGAQVA